MYYLSKVLNPVEIRYTPIEKLCVVLYFAITKLKHYLIKSRVYVVFQIEFMKYMLNRPIITGRICKWSLTLSEFTLIYFPQKSVKVQAGNKISEISAEISAKFRLSVEIDKISPPKF